MSACGEFLDCLGAEEHVVQLYGKDDSLLTQNVGRYLGEGLRRGDGILVIATPEHRSSLVRRLREDAGYSRAVLEGRLVFLDAEATLGRFLVNGWPDLDLFRNVVREAVHGVRNRAVHSGVRAYGEMVGLLWSSGEHAAAIRLEELWNDLLKASDVSLLCAYPIDVLGPEFELQRLDLLLGAHTHLLSLNDGLEEALHRAMDEVLGARVEGLKRLIQDTYQPSRASIPKAEALVLWLRANLPGTADQILDLAREYYQGSHLPQPN
jgi:DcmR-like sensory protein